MSDPRPAEQKETSTASVPAAQLVADSASGATQASAVTPEPRMPPQAVWDCKVLKIGEGGKPAGPLEDEITVGQKFLLDCEGAPLSLRKESLHLDLPKADRYALRLLEIQSLSESSGTFVATTWATGKVQLNDVIITDEENRLGLDGIRVEVKSVIDQEANPEMKPAPPHGPVGLMWPFYVWVFLAAMLLFAAFVFGRLFLKSRHRRKLLAELAKHGTALSPFNQFNKELRRLARQFPASSGGAGATWTQDESKQYLTELNNSFRWFLARELIVPAFDFTASQTVKEIKRTHPGLHKLVRKDLTLALAELDKALTAKATASADDAHQITELCRALADRIAKSKAQTRSA